MVAIRSLFILSAAVGIASAGKCKPESRSSSVVSVLSSTASASDAASSTASASATLIGSTTPTTTDTTVETNLIESATETASSADATETGTTESKPTTFLTSFTTSNADTTTELAATTTSTASGPVVTCPSDVEQCLGTMEIQCNVILSGLDSPTIVADLNECAQQCNSDISCVAFTYSEGQRECFKVTASQSYGTVNLSGWVSGIKGTCSQSTEPSSTVFTSTAETTTTEAATTTTAAAPVNNCPSETGQCINGALIQCDVALGDLSIAGISNDITECSQFCAGNDDCRGFSRRRDTGACFLVFVDPDDVTQEAREGWDSGIMYSCFN
ncbi:hypothetical protein BFJ66_g9074 [Fusarium oxysporum f. sp. cepae]|uniref:Apple domain-containing protein n=1 Tax=Fusarium oxysporum f. sp. cepae TaxID=396571 RepID=A0A3L6NXP5_FUSOX|nr:hypothetical protein BFJ65_g2287 [Fusarium oxysporum f. sp. cepae]RKK45506.1 hypothetical protein BFJ66_g9074 [Fusarium oxysporum f. sp. cepae]RKK53696.1 hypothetical protein BFJ67_g5032 [Fusarium oxysporum f. sp. cepae]